MGYKEVIFGDKKKTIRIEKIIPLRMQTDTFFEGTSNLAMWPAPANLLDSFTYKIIQLSRDADWCIRKYRGELYLIALKKDC